MRFATANWVAGMAIASVTCLLVMNFADARGRGGGRGMGGARGGMHRAGPAARGSFQRPRTQPRPRQPVQRNLPRADTRPQVDQRDRADTRPQVDQRDRPADRSQEDRQERRDERQAERQERQEERQDFREERWDDIEDFYDERQDWYEEQWENGAWVSVSYWSTMGCPTTPIYVNGMTYYDCNGVRYERVMRGTQVTYIVVN